MKNYEIVILANAEEDADAVRDEVTNLLQKSSKLENPEVQNVEEF